MDERIKEQIEALDTRRAQILSALCESRRITNPEVILNLVNEIRGITSTLEVLGKLIKDEKE